MPMAPINLPADSVASAAGFFGDSQAVALVGIIVLIVFLMAAARRRRRLDDGNSPRAYAREQIARLRDERAVHRDMEELLKQLEQITRQTNAQLDAKFAKLDKLIRDADDRAAKLERLVRRAEGPAAMQTLDVTLDDDPRAPREPSPAANTRHQSVYALADAGRTPVEIAQEVGQTTGEIELILALRRKAS